MQETAFDEDQAPVGHVWHVPTSVAAATAEKVPPTHATQDTAPAADQPPAVQGVQLTDPNSPTLLPASHARHDDWPTYGLKFPRLHRAHTDDETAAVAVELVPVPQAVQAAGPLAVL